MNRIRVVKIITVLFLVLVYDCHIGNTQFDTNPRINQRHLSSIQKEHYMGGRIIPFERYKPKGSVLIRDLFENSIKNHFNNQGFLDNDKVWEEMDKLRPSMGGGEGDFFVGPEKWLIRTAYAMPLKKLELPDVIVVPAPEIQLPRFNPKQPYPDLVPPHLADPSDSVESETDKFSDQLPMVDESKDIAAKPSTFDDLPVLPQPQAEEIPTPLVPTPTVKPADLNYQYQQPRFRIPPALPTRQVLTEEQKTYQRGIDAFKYRNYIKAQYEFSDLVAKNPESYRAHFGHGLCLFYSGKYEEALDALGKSYRLAKQNGKPEPNVWEMNVNPRDFQYHHGRLQSYVNNHRSERVPGTLLFLLTHAGVAPPPDRREIE